MTPRSLRIRAKAANDLKQRATYLNQQRGQQFGETYTRDLISWLQSIAQNGASPGTSISTDKSIKTLSYKRQATVLIEFTQTEMRVARIYFRGQDWRR